MLKKEVQIEQLKTEKNRDEAKLFICNAWLQGTAAVVTQQVRYRGHLN
jgi:hypothetical protein